MLSTLFSLSGKVCFLVYFHAAPDPDPLAAVVLSRSLGVQETDGGTNQQVRDPEHVGGAAGQYPQGMRDSLPDGRLSPVQVCLARDGL